MVSMETNKPTTKVARKNTSVFVREDLWEEIKVQAIRRKITVSEAVEEAIVRWLNRLPEINNAA